MVLHSTKFKTMESILFFRSLGLCIEIFIVRGKVSTEAVSLLPVIYIYI